VPSVKCFSGGPTTTHADLLGHLKLARELKQEGHAKGKGKKERYCTIYNIQPKQLL